MKRLKYLLCSVLICMLVLTGCTKTISFTYTIENGDKVKVTMSTDKDYKLSTSGNHFILSLNGDNEDAMGLFMVSDTYDEWFSYNSALSTDTVEGDNWTMLTVNNGTEVEYDYCFDISGTDKTYAVVAVVGERQDDLVNSITIVSE